MADKVLNVQDFTWHVIINPNACDRKCFHRWNEVSDKLTAAGVNYELHKAEGLNMGMETAKNLCTEGVRHLIVVGGDGTINEVVNGIMLSGVDPREVYLAVLPLGRANDWARTHNFPSNYLDTVDVFLKGNFMHHDIGKVQTLQQNEVKAERYFANIAGFGFDAEVIYDVNYNKPRFMGISVYLLSLVRSLFSYKSVPVRVQGPGIDYHGESFFMVAAICQYNGGGMCQAPMAKPNDGKMDVVFIPKVSKFRVMTLVKPLFKGKHIEKVKHLVKVHQTPEVLIKTDQLFRAEVEGELLETGDYKVSLIPKSLNMLTNIS